MDPRPVEAAGQADGAFWFTVAKMEAAAGEVPEAIQAFKKAIELAPEDPYVRLEYADLLQRAGRLRQAAEVATAALALAPNNPDVLRLAGHVRLELASRDPGSLELAKRAFERLREIEPQDAASMLTLSRIYLSENAAERATDLLEEAMAYTPGHPAIQRMLLEALIRAGDEERALEILPRLLRQDPSFTEGRRALAQILGEQGRHGEAIRLLSEAPPEDLREGDTLYLLASELYRRASSGTETRSSELEDLARAADLVDQILGQQPTHLRAVYLRALILERQSRRREAIEELRRLREVAPQELRLQVVTRLAELLEEEGEVAAAASLLAELAQRSNGADDGGPSAGRVWLEVARLHGRHEEWEELHAAALKLMDGTDAELRREGLLLAAEALQQLGRMQDALALLARAEQELEGDVGLALKRAEILTATGHAEEAERILAEVAGSEDRSALLAVAHYHLRRDRHEAAVPVLEKLLRRAEGLDEGSRRDVALQLADSLIASDEAERALRMLAWEEATFTDVSQLETLRLRLKKAAALEALGREDEAAQVLADLALESDRRSVLLLAHYYQQRSRYEEMASVLERALANSETEGVGVADIDLHSALGIAYERLGDHAAAADAFRRVLDVDPDDSNALNSLGYMWAERGQHLEEALELIRRAVDLEPDNGAYLDSLGWVYYQLGRYDKARRYLERAARLLPEDAVILEHLGDLYVALDIPEKARELYQKALAISDENVEGVRRKLAQLEVGDS